MNENFITIMWPDSLMIDRIWEIVEGDNDVDDDAYPVDVCFHPKYNVMM